MKHHNMSERKLYRPTTLAVGILLATIVVPVPAEAASDRIEFGFPASRLAEFVQDENLAIGYGSVWAGSWNQVTGGDTGFNAIKTAIDRSQAVGAQTIVHWWYWGDESWNVNCYSSGCQDSHQPVFKTMSAWNERSVKLADAILSTSAPGEVIVVVETEFNKGDDVNGHYSDEMSAMIASKIDYFQSRGIPAMTTLGNWRQADWPKFATAVNSGDYTGVMLLWSCTWDASRYDTAATQIVADTGKLKTYFPSMRIIVPDFGVSSYSCSTGHNYEVKQENVIKNLTAKRQDLKNNDVVGFVFRELVDVDMDNGNYHGAAEDYWGFKFRDAAHTPKRAYDDVVALIALEQQAQGPSIPGKMEAESFASRPVGGLYTNAAWSNGKGWNIWANGSIEQSFQNPATGTYAIDVRAMGGLGGSELPHMRLYANNVLVGEWDVGSTVATYTAQAALTAGTVTLRIQFTNDFQSGTIDRNLLVDYVQTRSSVPIMPGTVEAESFAYKSTGASFNSASYSGGKGWNIWTYGYIEQTVHSPISRSYVVEIRAAGDLAGTEYPRMVLKQNGVVVGTWDVTTPGLQTYAVTRTLSAGDTTFRIEFMNDYNGGPGNDRNLKVDNMRLV